MSTLSPLSLFLPAAVSPGPGRVSSVPAFADSAPHQHSPTGMLPQFRLFVSNHVSQCNRDALCDKED
jgi:hypothetical protein